MAKKRKWLYPPTCRACGPCKKDDFTRHHMVPRKDPRFNEHLLSRRKGAITIGLCKPCHRLVHDTFGEGHCFIGPTTVKHLIRWLKITNAKTTYTVSQS